MSTFEQLRAQLTRARIRQNRPTTTQIDQRLAAAREARA